MEEFKSYNDYEKAKVPEGLIIYDNGRKVYMKKLLIHRDDGPAVIWEDGRESFYKNGILIKS